MSSSASIQLDTILENTPENDYEDYGSGLSGIPMPEVEEISMKCSGLGEFGEVYLQELESPEEPRRTDPQHSSPDRKIQPDNPLSRFKVHQLAIEPLDVNPWTSPAPKAAREAHRQPQNNIALPRKSLSPEQANSLNTNAIAEAFAPVEGTLSVIPEVADCIRWLKQPLYDATMDDGRLFITAGHPSLKLITALIDFGHTIQSVRDPAWIKLTELVRLAATLNARDFQKYAGLTAQVHQAMNAADNPGQKVTAWLWGQSERLLPARQPALKPIEFNRSMLRYELAVHKLMRTIWPLILKQIEQQSGRQSAQWQAAFLVYGNVLRSTQVVSRPVAKLQMIDSLPGTIAELLKVFSHIGLKEVIREEIICRLMQVHLAIARGRDGKKIREHRMDAAFAFRCLKGNVFAEQEYQQIFTADGRLSAACFEKLLSRVSSKSHRLTALEEYTIAGYRSVLSTEPETNRLYKIRFNLPQAPDFKELMRNTLNFLSSPPTPAFAPAGG